MLDEFQLETLRPLFLGISIMLLLVMLYFVYTLPTVSALLSVVLVLAVSGAFLRAHRLIQANRIPVSLAHPLAAAMSMVGYVALLYDLVARGEEAGGTRFVGLALMVVTTSMLYLKFRWFLGMMAVIFTTWIATNVALNLDLIWSEHLIIFVIIALVALMNFSARKRAIVRVVDAQLENARQNDQLTAAIERAHQSEARLRAERDLADQVVDSMGQGLALLDDAGAIEYVNPAAARIIGHSPETLVGRAAADILQAGDEDLARTLAGPSAAAQSEESFEVLVEREDGQTVSVLVSVSPRETGGPIVTMTDLTLRKQFERELARLAHHDALTGLPNRALFTERLEQALIRTQRWPSRAAVLFLDLDRFKRINDTVGHAVGDQVLIETANRVKECIREQDTLARLGGDEFVALLVDLIDGDEALAVADRIAARLEEPIVIDEAEYTVAVSIGIALNQAFDVDPHALIDKADTAMYEAKRRHDIRRALYTPDMRAHPAVAVASGAALPV